MTSEALHLYYFPTSFYSQKALIALREKGLSYKETVINITSGEQLEPWFLRLNPAGKVPCLKIGDKLITESEQIVDAVDRIQNGKGTRLVPDPATTEGQTVSKWRTKIDDIQAEDVTFGVLLNPELHTPDIKVPKAFLSGKDAYTSKMKSTIEKLEAMKVKNPDLQQAIDSKIAENKIRIGDSRFSLTNISKYLEEVDAAFDEIETHLRNNKIEHKRWLCGSQFTAADINLCVLLGRIDFIGLLDRFVDPQKRPALLEYWNQSQQRETVRLTTDVMTAMKKYMMKKMLTLATKVAGGSLVAVGVVALSVLLAKRINTS